MIMCHMAYKGEGKVGQGCKKGTVGDVEDKCSVLLLFLHGVCPEFCHGLTLGSLGKQRTTERKNTKMVFLINFHILNSEKGIKTIIPKECQYP